MNLDPTNKPTATTARKLNGNHQTKDWFPVWMPVLLVLAGAVSGTYFLYGKATQTLVYLELQVNQNMDNIVEVRKLALNIERRHTRRISETESAIVGLKTLHQK